MRVNSKEVKELMEKYSLSYEDACTLWLEDNGDVENEEIKEIEKKVKKMGSLTGAGHTKSTEKRTRTTKNSDEKIEVWKDIVEYLSDIYEIEIITDEKLLEINYKGKNFKLNLSETKKKKA